MKRTEKFSSHILPMPIREFLNPGKMWESRTGISRYSWQDAEDVWNWSVAALTWILGAWRLILVQGALTVKYMSMDPKSAMADVGVVVGRVGLKSVVVHINKYKLLSTTAPHRHIPAYHPRLVSTPGPEGLDLVVDSTWP